MNARDIMIGDLVKHRGKVKKVVYINDRINHKGHHNNAIAFTSDEDEWICAEWAEPIPLTKEMLVENGFEEFGEMLGGKIQHRLYMGDAKIKIDVTDSNLFDLSYGSNVICDFHYVHELQHALRLCGLNDTSDNFKI